MQGSNPCHGYKRESLKNIHQGDNMEFREWAKAKLDTRKSTRLFTMQDFKDYFAKNKIKRYYVEEFYERHPWGDLKGIKMLITFLDVHWYSFLLKRRIKKVKSEIPNIIMCGIPCGFIVSSKKSAE